MQIPAHPNLAKRRGAVWGSGVGFQNKPVPSQNHLFSAAMRRVLRCAGTPRTPDWSATCQTELQDGLPMLPFAGATGLESCVAT